MADQGLWFKLWCAALDDPDLDNLEIGDFGRWCKLGAFIKRHGEGGTVVLRPPCRGLVAWFQVRDFDAAMSVIEALPGVCMRRDNDGVSGETVATVTFGNWRKYQGDMSTPRVRKFRAMKRPRGEEKRGDEKRKRSIPPVAPTTDFKIADSILTALGRCRKLGAVSRLRDPAYWQAVVRAYPGVDLPAVILDAESFLTTPRGAHYADLAGFLRNSIKRAHVRNGGGA